MPVTSRPAGRWRRVTRGFVMATVVVASTATAGVAAAVPPPPPNPSDSTIDHAEAAAHATADRVGKLTSQVARAQARVQQLADELELKQERANKALVDLQRARQAAARAERAARTARAQADAAGARIRQARQNLDAFAAGSYEQGSTIGSISAFIGAKNPSDLLQRASLLNAVSSEKLDALDGMRRARVLKANADAAARAALRQARQRRAAAAQAKQTADDAKAAAEAAAASQRARVSTLQQRHDQLEQRLAAASARVGNLRAQRANYNRWLAEKKAEEAAARRAAQTSSSGSGAPAGHGAVAAVIGRARSVLGVTYAWGGGNAYGPSRGIHDGGVADAYGDYHKIGFDCSGLMVYAFAAAGVSLPHYSGYQYDAGYHVPLSQIRPGDMLFWSFDGTAGGIHHVALYIGNGMMIEAPYSGSQVRITSVRYGGIMPYAARVL